MWCIKKGFAGILGIHANFASNINPIRDGGKDGGDGGQKASPSSFPPVTSTNVSIPGASPKLLNLNQEHLPKKDFWSNPYNIEAIITSLIETWSYQTLVKLHMSQVIKFCWGHHRQKLCHHNLYFKIPLF